MYDTIDVPKLFYGNDRKWLSRSGDHKTTDNRRV